jgi:hypothetical protein
MSQDINLCPSRFRHRFFVELVVGRTSNHGVIARIAVDRHEAGPCASGWTHGRSENVPLAKFPQEIPATTNIVNNGNALKVVNP